MIFLNKIISGGQTGADQAGLRAARRLGLETGGWAPRDFMTLEGPAPWLGTEFGLMEHPGGYSGRTVANVHDSDATIRFASKFWTPGERRTLSAITQYKKPHLDFDLSQPLDGGRLLSFIEKKQVKVLNVAGNAEAHAPGIGKIVEEFLVRTLNKTLTVTLKETESIKGEDAKRVKQFFEQQVTYKEQFSTRLGET